MPITNRPDPNYEPEERTSFSDGKYSINGIAWVSNDDSGAPIFKVRKNSTALYAIYRTVTVDGKDGPPGSVSPAQVSVLVSAFGGDPDKLPDREEDPTAYLISARDMINSQNKVLEVTVQGGWVQEIPGMSLPVNKYFTFELNRITTKNEQDELCWVESKQGYGPWFGVELVAVGSMNQKPTPYDGVTVWDIVSYGLTVSPEGDPTFETNANGKWTSAAVATDRFIAAFVPDVVNYEFSNPANILPEIWELYKRNRRRAVTQVIKRGKSNRVGVNISGLVSTEDDGMVEPKQEETKEAPARDVETETQEPASMAGVYDLISKGLGQKAFDSAGNLNDAGKAWCKENLKPFLTEKHYPAAFSRWTPEMTNDVYAFLSQEEDEF